LAEKMPYNVHVQYRREAFPSVKGAGTVESATHGRHGVVRGFIR
jgi:hypothetical protein